ncbi:hypothetical protein V6N11_034346 [Hibiscus sabdariffa]|uniref:Uncharacterized protein n=1 Tax=Hibiscus sabdariffa TaxID=183260 RepID=A0ABR1ZJ85_9ROSI
MVFRFNDEGGFNTEDGLLIAASGVFSKISSESEMDENLLFWASGVLNKDAMAGLDELIWSSASSEEYELSVGMVVTTLRRTVDGDLVLEQYLCTMSHNRT